MHSGRIVVSTLLAARLLASYENKGKQAKGETYYLKQQQQQQQQ